MLVFEMNKRTSFFRCAMFYTLISLGLYAAYIAVIELNVMLSSDISYAGTLLPECSEWLYQGLELVAFFTSYAFILFARFVYGWLGEAAIMVIYFFAALARYVALWALGMIDGWAAVANLIPELIQLSVIAFICHLSVCSFEQIYDVMACGATQLGEACPSRLSLVYPAKRRKKDALLRGAFWSAFLVSIIRVIGRIIYDVMWGWPTDIVDALWMMLYYGLDIIIGIGGYFLILWVIRVLAHHES